MECACIKDGVLPSLPSTKQDHSSAALSRNISCVMDPCEPSLSLLESVVLLLLRLLRLSSLPVPLV